MAPISVATAPKIISSGIPPASRLEMRQPMNSPGIAAGVNAGRTHSASEMRNWIAPLDSPASVASSVSTT